jgi:hypothetical protein
MQSQLEIVCNMKVPWAMFLHPNEICNVRICNSNLRQALQMCFVSSALWPVTKFSALDAKLQKHTKHLLLLDIPCLLNLQLLTYLQSITFNETFNSCVQLPPTLEKLCFGREFNQLFKHFILPPNLRELELGVGYECRLLDGVLPTTLQKLTLQGRFDQRVDILPPSLKELYLFGGPILIVKPFPCNLTYLYLPTNLTLRIGTPLCVAFHNVTADQLFCVYVNCFDPDQIQAESLHALLAPHLH